MILRCELFEGSVPVDWKKAGVLLKFSCNVWNLVNEAVLRDLRWDCLPGEIFELCKNFDVMHGILQNSFDNRELKCEIYSDLI